ncbi:MAG: MBOAT family protein [Leptospiraceae bacterium]|nr:MBOAT family protein [Leptospiraceae bacterium]
MLFNSVHYFLFAPLVFLVYFWLPLRWQRIWLFLASIYFYAVFKVPFVALLLFSIFWTYLCMVGIDRSRRAGRSARLYLVLAILGNLSLLFVFKYLDFFIRALNVFAGHEVCDPDYMSPVGFIVPMGISFFTLQAISAAWDQYRQTIEKPKSAYRFGLYLSFFPQLVAGPIIRAQDLIDQFESRHTFNLEDFRLGMQRLTMGVFKKTFIADQLGPYVDSVYADPGQYSSGSMWIAVFFHAVQIYCDFAGYSDIAIGTARVLGFRVPENFDRPFFSTTMTEFWRRWHISFSSWLRDYIYIPLGGSRVGISRAYLNVFMVMAISGLWHGADWNFIFWGALHGAFLLLEKYLFSFPAIKSRYDKIPLGIRNFYTFFVFAIAILFFRAKPLPDYGSSISVGFYIFNNLFTLKEGIAPAFPATIVALAVVLFVIEGIQVNRPKWIEENALFNHPVFQIALCGGLLGIAFIIYSVTVSQQFIYFQF